MKTYLSIWRNINMKYIVLISDLDCVEIKEVPDELYERIREWLKVLFPMDEPFPKFQKLYDNLCDPRLKDKSGKLLWEELEECKNIDAELIQQY